MGIDHVIDYDCQPKTVLTTPGILTRLKAQQRAEAVIRLYRDHQDYRPPSEMGFEMVRRRPDGSEETQVIVVQELLDSASDLERLAPHCVGCPANRAGKAFGCFGNINYPISQAGELWLLKQLPTPDDPLVFLLMSRTMRDFVFDRDELRQMRSNVGVFFETDERFAKSLEDAQITTDQVFEMLFLTERIKPDHAAVLMLYFGAIPRDINGDTLMALTQEGEHTTPFIMPPDPADDDTIAALKAYFEALHRAHRLNVSVSLDA